MAKKVTKTNDQGRWFRGFTSGVTVLIMTLSRGPFHSTHAWLASCLEIIIKDQITAKEEAEGEEDEEDAAFALALASRLADLLPKIFPPVESHPEQSVILHEDLSLTNILINEQGEITALLDWECVSAMPLWMATTVPKFLCRSD